jgi:hypothetical protein
MHRYHYLGTCHPSLTRSQAKLPNPPIRPGSASVRRNVWDVIAGLVACFWSNADMWPKTAPRLCVRNSDRGFARFCTNGRTIASPWFAFAMNWRTTYPPATPRMRYASLSSWGRNISATMRKPNNPAWMISSRRLTCIVFGGGGASHDC